MRSIEIVFSMGEKVFLWATPYYYLFGFKHNAITYVVWSQKRKFERHVLSIPNEFHVPCLNVE